MAIISANNLSQTYKNEYSAWRENKKFQEAKRQEYLRANPDAIKEYDRQRAKVLLSIVDSVDKSVSLNADHMNTVVDSITSLGLGYAAVSGAALGLIFQRLKFVQKFISNIVTKYPKSKNLVSMGITTLSGVLGVVVAYPVYAFFSNMESKIDRKKRFDTMEKELQDPKIFAALDVKQNLEFLKNLSEIDKAKQNSNFKNPIEKSYKNLKKSAYEIMYYDREQTKFRKKYEEDKSFYECDLTDDEIRKAKKDKVLLCVLLKELNMTAQTYTEKMQKITDNLITFSFALGSILTLGYERISKSLNFKKSSLPSGMGIYLMLLSTLFATWAQKRAAHIGRFKAKQDLMENPERLIYVSNRRTSTIEEDSIQVEPHKPVTTWQFIKDFYKDNKEYEKWKKSPTHTGREISQAMENIEITPVQLADAQRLKTNMFKSFYKVDSNTQNYSSKVDFQREAVKFPMMLVLGSLGSLFGAKNLVKISNAVSRNEIFKETLKYIGTISFFTLPTLFVNSYFAKMQKMGARISDMLTMNELEDYRFFADYSRYNNNQE